MTTRRTLTIPSSEKIFDLPGIDTVIKEWQQWTIKLNLHVNVHSLAVIRFMRITAKTPTFIEDQVDLISCLELPLELLTALVSSVSIRLISFIRYLVLSNLTVGLFCLLADSYR